MSHLLLPELSVAHGTAALLQEADLQQRVPFQPACPLSALREQYGMRTLRRFKYIADVTKDISINELQDTMLSSWDDLAMAAHTLVMDAAEPYKDKYADDLPFDDRLHAEERLEHDSRAGAAQIAAFLQVLPRVLYDADLTSNGTSLRARAQRSKGTMVRWSKLDDVSDARLLYGVAYPKPDVDLENPYDGIRYHTKWFEEKLNGAVGLRANKLRHIQDQDGKHLLVETGQKAILGCPAFNLVPRLYDAMVAAADNNALFETTRTLERKNLGYSD